MSGDTFGYTKNIKIPPKIQRAIDSGTDSVTFASTIATTKGITDTIEDHGTPTFPPHARHLVGRAGPNDHLRQVGIPDLLQRGHVYTVDLQELKT